MTSHKQSVPPVSAKGLSWRVVGAALGLFGAALVPTATMIWQGGVASQERRQLIVEVRGMRSELDAHGEWIAGTKVRLDHVEGEVRDLKERWRRLRD